MLIIEKYRPYYLEDLVLSESLYKYIYSYIKTSSLDIDHECYNRMNLIISGIQGIGKTSAARCIFKEIIIDYYKLDRNNKTEIKKEYKNHVFELKPENAYSKELIVNINDIIRRIETHRDSRFYLIVDEIDEMSDHAMNTFLELMKIINNDHSDNKQILKLKNGKVLKLIFTCNNINAVSEQMQNYCSGVMFKPLNVEQIKSCIKKICVSENICVTNNDAINNNGEQISESVIHTIAENCNGDVRAAINSLHNIIINNKELNNQITFLKDTTVDNEKLIIAFESQNVNEIIKLLYLECEYELPHSITKLSKLFSTYNKISVEQKYKILQEIYLTNIHCIQFTYTKIQIISCIIKIFDIL